MASSELLAGLHSLRKWADDNNERFRTQDPSQSRPTAQLSPSPPRSPSPNRTPSRPLNGSHHPSLSNVRESLKELRKEAPRWIPMDTVASSPIKDLGHGSPQFVAQAEASRLQYAIKRRRMKPMPSMPTHADIISAVVRLQKDATQSLDSEVEVRKTLDFLSTVSSTLLHAFTSMVGISEQVMSDTEQARVEVKQVADEIRNFQNDTIRQMHAAIQQNSAQLEAVTAELRAIKGDQSAPRVGGFGSLVDVHATACKMADHLQEETAAKLQQERGHRNVREQQLLEKLEALEARVKDGQQQAVGDMSAVGEKLSDLMREVEAGTRELKTESSTHRDELGHEFGIIEQKQHSLAEQIHTLAHTQKVMAAKLEDADRHSHDAVVHADRCFQHTKDELNHMYSVLARQLSYDMSTQTMQLSSPGPPIPGASLPHTPAPAAPAPINTTPGANLQHASELRHLESRLDSIIAQTSAWSP